MFLTDAQHPSSCLNRNRIGFTFLLLEKAEKGKVPLVLPTQRSPRLQVPLSMGYQDEIQLDHDFMLCFFHLTEIQACFSGCLLQIPCEKQFGGYKILSGECPVGPNKLNNNKCPRRGTVPPASTPPPQRALPWLASYSQQALPMKPPTSCGAASHCPCQQENGQISTFCGDQRAG